jgi:hypothetical protein
VTGPVVGGALIYWQGLGIAYAAHLALILASIVLLYPVHAPRVSGHTRAGVHLDAIREGFAYVRSRPVILGAMSLDMFAVIFGGAKALLPIYAVHSLRAGAAGYGVLVASMEAFGLATIAFGLSRWLPLSIVAYAAVGVADQVNMVMRLNTIQLSIPDDLRGRVTAVNYVFVNASNQIGGLESGVVATLTSAPFAVVSGGLACLAVVAFIAWRIPELRSYQAHRAALA